jgi:hypothetical protein
MQDEVGTALLQACKALQLNTVNVLLAAGASPKVTMSVSDCAAQCRTRTSTVRVSRRV